MDITFLNIAPVVFFLKRNFKFLDVFAQNMQKCLREGRRKGNTGKKANGNILVKQERVHDTKAYLLPMLPFRCADWLQQ